MYWEIQNRKIYEFVNGNLKKGTQLADGEFQKTELFVGPEGPYPENFRTFSRQRLISCIFRHNFLFKDVRCETKIHIKSYITNGFNQ